MSYDFYPHAPTNEQREAIAQLIPDAREIGFMAAGLGLKEISSRMNLAANGLLYCLGLSDEKTGIERLPNKEIEHPLVPFRILQNRLTEIGWTKYGKGNNPLKSKAIQLNKKIEAVRKMFPPVRTETWREQRKNRNISEWKNPPLAIILRFGRSIDWTKRKFESVKWSIYRTLTGRKY